MERYFGYSSQSYIGKREDERRSKVATQGSYNGHERKETEGKSSREGYAAREYRGRDNRNGGDERSRSKEDFKPRENQNGGEYRKRENRGFRSNEGKSREGQPSNHEYKSRDGRTSGYKPRDNRNSFGSGYNNYKDEEDGKKVFRSAKSKPADKGKDPQPDKFETIKRLEREQKTIKKKESKRNKTESTRPQQRVKRQNNRNYMNDYANGMYDDYEDDF